nr:RNA-directed DNA polymerase, eukaryota [Tanacetum cinerariifolium]
FGKLLEEIHVTLTQFEKKRDKNATLRNFDQTWFPSDAVMVSKRRRYKYCDGVKVADIEETLRRFGGLTPHSLFSFPRAYVLESCKNIDVASKLSQNSLAFTFCREPRGGVEQDQFDSLKAMVEGISLVNIRDRWIWSLQNLGDFTVASIRKLIDEFTLSEVSSSTCWIKAVHIKVNVLAWKIKLDNLPTRLNISRRGMDIDSILCPTCGKAVESIKHIFFTCQIARDILHLITSWWNIPYMEVSSYEEWLVWISSLRLSIKHKCIFEGVCYVTWWHIWNFRNKTILGSESPSKAAIFDEVQSRSFYWCCCRCKAYFSWTEWLKNPHLVTL